MNKIVLAGGAYGFTMGIYQSLAQAVSSAVKVPVLLFISLAITLPALHYFHQFSGSKQKFAQSLAIGLQGMATMCGLLAALIPIPVFFDKVIGSSYSFLLVLHVLIFAIAGACGLTSIMRSESHLFPENDFFARETIWWLGRVWALLFMLVGTQSAYLLSPFLGRLSDEFRVLGDHPDNFFTHVLSCLKDLF